jgi:hypothetical protein
VNAKESYDSIAAEITDGQEVVASKMFGMPTLKVRGKAFAGLFGDSMSFKLRPDDLEQAMKLPGAGPFDPSGMGRAMGGWVLVKPAGQDSWLQLAERALAYVSTIAR